MPAKSHSQNPRQRKAHPRRIKSNFSATSCSLCAHHFDSSSYHESCLLLSIMDSTSQYLYPCFRNGSSRHASIAINSVILWLSHSRDSGRQRQPPTFQRFDKCSVCLPKAAHLPRLPRHGPSPALSYQRWRRRCLNLTSFKHRFPVFRAAMGEPSHSKSIGA